MTRSVTFLARCHPFAQIYLKVDPKQGEGRVRGGSSPDPLHRRKRSACPYSDGWRPSSHKDDFGRYGSTSADGLVRCLAKLPKFHTQ